VDLDHYLPELRGNNNNGKGGFIDTNILPEPGGDISDAKVLEVFSWMRAYYEESGVEYMIGNNVDIVDATTLALKFEGLPHIDPKCRLMFTTEYECMQLCIMNETIHMTFDGTDEKNRKESHFNISKYIMPELLVNGILVPTNKPIKVLRHKFEFHCTTSYLGTEREQADGEIPLVWKPPYEKDHASGDPSLQSSRQVRNCHQNDNKRAYLLKNKSDRRK
jgi:hypothetical protein